MEDPLPFGHSLPALIARGKLITHATPESLLRAVDGGVWEWQVPSSELSAVRQQFRVSAMARRTDGVLMRIVSSVAPGPGATPVTPTLEDAYLFAIGRAEGGPAAMGAADVAGAAGVGASAMTLPVVT